MDGTGKVREPQVRAPGPAQARRVAAIDGLRGFALLGMLAWHAQVEWVKGGFARMTIFFVLSGYLATASLLSMRRKHPEGAFRQFWMRRARRLLPVSLLGVAFAMWAAVVIDGSARESLRGDALSVIGNVSNWRFLLADQSYGELFERPSPFQHFWSLSLEEQCFWLLPLVLAGIGLLSKRRAWLAAAAIGAALAAIPLVVPHTPDAAYYGTHVRAGEFLAGVALALALQGRGGHVAEWARPALRWLGAGSLAALGAVMLFMERDLPWLYQGGLGLFAVPAVLVVVAALDEKGPVQWILSAEPLARIGRWAFPIYVLHWPIFLLLTPERVGFGGAGLVVLQLGVSIALGAAVHHFFEKPLMQRRPVSTGIASGAVPPAVLGATVPTGPPEARPTGAWASLMAWAAAAWGPARRSLGGGRPLFAGIASVTTGLVIVALLIPAQTGTGETGLDLRAAEARANTSEHPEAPGAAVGLFGGSTAAVLGAAAHDWTPSTPNLRSVAGSARLGCGLLTEGSRVHGIDTLSGQVMVDPPDDYCLDWAQSWASTVEAEGAQVALMVGGVWDTTDWQLPDQDGWLSIRDEPVAHVVRERLELAADLLAERGAFVALATTPLVGEGSSGDMRQRRGLGEDHAERVRIYNELVAEVAGERPYVSVVDYGSFIDQLDPTISRNWLPDGIHPTPQAALEIWSTFLGPQLEALTSILASAGDANAPEALGPAEPAA